MRVMGRRNRPACLGFLLLIFEGRQREVNLVEGTANSSQMISRRLGSLTGVHHYSEPLCTSGPERRGWCYSVVNMELTLCREGRASACLWHAGPSS